MKNAKEKKKRIQKGDFGYFSKEKKKRFLITLIMFAVPLFIFFSSWAYFDTRKTIWTVIAVVGCLPACKSMVSLIMILLRHPMDKELYEKIRQHQGELTMSYEMYMTFYEKSAYIDAFAICGNTVVGYSSDAKIDCEFMAREAQKIMSYEMYMTFYEKSAYIDAFAICGNTVVGYSSDAKIDCEFMAREAQKIIRKNGYKVDVKILKAQKIIRKNGYKVDVKILKELKPYLERLDTMNKNKASLEEGIKFTPDSRYPELSRNEMIKHTILAICL